MKDLFSPHPNFYSYKVSRFYDFISKLDKFGAQDFDRGTSSHYYNDLYAGGHSFLENVRDSAIAVGNGVIALQVTLYDRLLACIFYICPRANWICSRAN